MRWGLQGRIIAPVMLITVLAIALSAFLNYGKFLRTISDLEASRFSFIASDIKEVVEGGLDLGVSLRGMVTAQTVINDAMTRDGQISGVILFDETGKILFRAGAAPYEAAVPAVWVAALGGADSRWSASDGNTAIAGARLTNDIRQTVGGVAVLYSHRILAGMLRNVAERLGVAAAICALGTVLVAYLGVTVLVGRVRREVRRVEVVLEGGQGEKFAPPVEARRVASEALDEIAVLSADVERLGQRRAQ